MLLNTFPKWRELKPDSLCGRKLGPGPYWGDDSASELPPPSLGNSRWKNGDCWTEEDGRGPPSSGSGAPGEPPAAAPALAALLHGLFWLLMLFAALFVVLLVGVLLLILFILLPILLPGMFGVVVVFIVALLLVFVVVVVVVEVMDIMLVLRLFWFLFLLALPLLLLATLFGVFMPPPMPLSKSWLPPTTGNKINRKEYIKCNYFCLYYATFNGNYSLQIRKMTLINIHLS